MPCWPDEVLVRRLLRGVAGDLDSLAERCRVLLHDRDVLLDPSVRREVIRTLRSASRLRELLDET